MKRINLSSGKFTIVDDEDFDSLNQVKWWFNGKYAVRETSRKEGHKKIYIHRVIMKAPQGVEVDHVNHDTLDNRKENLRLCTHQQNAWNISLPKHNTSGVMGVSWQKNRHKWQAGIKVNNKRIHLGSFTTIDSAAIAYEKARQVRSV